MEISTDIVALVLYALLGFGLAGVYWLAGQTWVLAVSVKGKSGSFEAVHYMAWLAFAIMMAVFVLALPYQILHAMGELKVSPKIFPPFVVMSDAMYLLAQCIAGGAGMIRTAYQGRSSRQTAPPMHRGSMDGTLDRVPNSAG
jgi:hypothetical protein